MQSSDPSGRNITCVPIPNVSGLQSQINTETANRQAADTQLQNNINATAAVILQQIQEETSDRKAADDALRNAVIEQSIVGSYTFSGSVNCLNASNGFDPVLLTTNPASPTAATLVSTLNGLSYGTRTFNADNTGHVDVTTHSLVTPNFSYQQVTQPNGQVTVIASVGFGGPNGAPGGSVSVVEQHGDFTWQILDGTLYITEPDITGTFTQGARAGWSTTTTGQPRAVAVLGKDLRTITTRSEDVTQEKTVQTPGPGQNGQPVTGFRICTRERTLRKLP